MAYGKKRVHDLTTGEIVEVDLSPEEIAARDAERAAGEAQDTLRQQLAAERDADLEDVRAAQVEAALTQIDADIALLAGTPTAQQQRDIVTRLLQRQRRIIKAVWRLVE